MGFVKVGVGAIGEKGCFGQVTLGFRMGFEAQG